MAYRQNSTSTKNTNMKWYDYPVVAFFAFNIWMGVLTLNLISVVVLCILWKQYENFVARR